MCKLSCRVYVGAHTVCGQELPGTRKGSQALTCPSSIRSAPVHRRRGSNETGPFTSSMRPHALFCERSWRARCASAWARRWRRTRRCASTTARSGSATSERRQRSCNWSTRCARRQRYELWEGACDGGSWGLVLQGVCFKWAPRSGSFACTSGVHAVAHLREKPRPSLSAAQAAPARARAAAGLAPGISGERGHATGGLALLLVQWLLRRHCATQALHGLLDHKWALVSVSQQQPPSDGLLLLALPEPWLAAVSCHAWTHLPKRDHRMPAPGSFQRYTQSATQPGALQRAVPRPRRQQPRRDSQGSTQGSQKRCVCALQRAAHTTLLSVCWCSIKPAGRCCVDWRRLINVPPALPADAKSQ